MKPNATVAIVLSCLAIVISLIQPTYNYYIMSITKEEGIPSFSIWGGPDFSDFYTFSTFTRITIWNNGTATAHNVKVELTFYNPPAYGYEATQFIPEIQDDARVMIKFPIGDYHLESTIPDWNGYFTNASRYEAYVHITCKELSAKATGADTDKIYTFHFTDFC